jgi:Leucine-rich repeat (LRR) protein
LPELLKLSPELKGLVDLNLSKNNLFNSDQVFEVLYDLPQLVRLDVSFNVLNGTLTGLVGRLDQLEELHLDSNNLVALPASISGMRALTVLSVADNLLTGLTARRCANSTAKTTKSPASPEQCFGRARVWKRCNSVATY